MIIAYSATAIVLHNLQKKFIFRPKPLPQDYEYNFKFPFREINISLNKTDNLNLVQFFPENKLANGVVLYFHGNRDNINRYAKHAVNFTKNGYEVWMADYPGYGKTTGKQTEENFYSQAMEIFKLATSKYSSESIIIYGMSLGSGIASYLASKKSCKRLILETPYFSMPDLLNSLVPIIPVSVASHFKFPTGEYCKEIHAPITIFHGRKDRVIPYRCAAKLNDVLKAGDEFITISQGAHNNLSNFRQYHEKLDSILSA
jgi:alpha-beta hydrolase superfamily lysophospholipase